MDNRNVLPTIWMLISAALVFSALLIYLNVLFFKQGKEQIEAQCGELIAQSFFEIPYNAAGLELYANTLLQEKPLQIHQEAIKSKLQDIYIDYKRIPSNIDTVFDQMAIDLSYRWAISVPKLEVRDSNQNIMLIDSKNDFSKELILFGVGAISASASKYNFYRISDSYYNQVNLYIELNHTYLFIAKRMIPIFIGDLVLVILFVLIIRRSILTLWAQQKIMTTQTDLLNAVSHEFNTPLSSIKLGGQALVKFF